MTARTPLPPHRPERSPDLVRRLAGPALAVLHLIAFGVLYDPARVSFAGAAWPGSAFLALAFLLARDLATSRKRDRLPDILSSLAWGAAGGLEAARLWEPIAATRLVPAVLFPLFGYLLPLPAAAACGLGAVSAMFLGHFGGRPVAAWDGGIVAMAVLGIGAGHAARRKLSRAGDPAGGVREAIERSRAILLPWESGTAGGDEEPAAVREDAGLLRWRGELEDGIRRVLEGILPATGADAVYFVAAAAPGGKPFPRRPAVRTGEEGRLGSVEIPDSFAPVREAILFRRTIMADADEAAVWPLENDGRPVTLSGIAAVPVFAGDRVEGAILAVRVRDEVWAEPVIQLLETAAFFIGLEHERARASHRQASYLARQAGLHEIVKRIAEVAEKGGSGEETELSPRRAVYRAAVSQVRELFRFDRVLLIESDEEKGDGAARVAWEEEKNGRPGGEGAAASVAGTYVEWVLNNGTHRIFSDITAGAMRHPVLPAAWSREGEVGYMLFPVSGAGGFRGVLACVSREERAFDRRDAETVREVLSVTRMGISHALRTETLARQAERDGLTGLYNHKTFRRLLGSILDRSDERYPGAVIMLDIDYFKKINDSYGHPTGDEVLKNVSRIIAKTIRKGDIAGRYGGEEFAIYLHFADRDQAATGADRLRLMIQKSRLQAGGAEIGVTASLGVACYPVHGKRPEDLLRRADEALYRSKQEGRNRVTVC